MKLYLAGRYSRKEEITKHAETIRATGLEVCSTWITEPHGPAVQLKDVVPQELREYALRDLEELRLADAFVIYAESDQTYNKRGGRHVEHGFALALGKPIFVVGPHENIFHYLPSTQHFSSTEALVEALQHESPAAPSSPYSAKSPASRCVR